MKNTRSCPKCEGTQLETYPGRRLGFGGGNYVSITALTPALVDRIVCMTCGFCEEWISGASLAKVRKFGRYIEIPEVPGSNVVG